MSFGHGYNAFDGYDFHLSWCRSVMKIHDGIYFIPHFLNEEESCDKFSYSKSKIVQSFLNFYKQ